jgi:hypothetical protein
MYIPAYGNEAVCSCLPPHFIVGGAWPRHSSKQQGEVTAHDQVTHSRYVLNQSIEDRAKETLEGLTLRHFAGVGGACRRGEGVEGGGRTRALAYHGKGVGTRAG